MTKQYYDHIKVGCECAYCVNYRENCKFFDNELMKFFEALGIDPQKEGEFMDFGKIDEEKRHYSGFYHFVGKIISGPKFSSFNWDKKEMIMIGDIFFGFSNNIELLPKDFPEPVVQLEFEGYLPWLLDEKPD